MADVAVAPPQKRRRYVGKTNPQVFCLWVLNADEEQDATRQVYLVTLAHPKVSHSADGVALVAPSTFGRAAVHRRRRCCALDGSSATGYVCTYGFLGKKTRPSESCFWYC